MLLQPSTSVVGVRLAAPVGLWHLVGTKRAGCWWWWWSDPSQCLRAVQTSELSVETKNKCVPAVNLSFKAERVLSASCFRVLPQVAREHLEKKSGECMMERGWRTSESSWRTRCW